MFRTSSTFLRFVSPGLRRKGNHFQPSALQKDLCPDAIHQHTRSLKSRYGRAELFSRAFSTEPVAPEATPAQYIQLNNMLSSFVRMVDRSINVPNNGLTVEQLRSYLTEDCTWEFEGDYPKKSQGIASIAADFNGFHSQFKAGVHHYTNRVIDTRAGRMSWYSYAVWDRAEDGARITFNGDYQAEIVEECGTWKIRKVVTRPLL
eukprot:TRINITY_DN43795_c0_g1_i1.p1 TRINITY_DN43795_c0_g1~~TRINITY_DN43795_c0_g1_i1.p1  ORF type:complete len:204 (+),score=22.05 TRINITY_DN43795_c0_g1_i1:145-756(+)